MSMVQEAALAIAHDPDITKSRVALVVLKYLEGRLDYENAIRVVQSKVAADLGLQRASVNRAFKLLLGKGIIEQVTAPSLKPVYRLNPRYGWRGNHKTWKAAFASATPLRLVRGGREDEPTPEKIALATGAPSLFET